MEQWDLRCKVESDAKIQSCGIHLTLECDSRNNKSKKKETLPISRSSCISTALLTGLNYNLKSERNDRAPQPKFICSWCFEIAYRSDFQGSRCPGIIHLRTVLTYDDVMITVYRNVDKQIPPYAPKRLWKPIYNPHRGESLIIPACFLAASLTFLFGQANLLAQWLRCCATNRKVAG